MANTSKQQITLLIVDDHSVVRQGLCSFLEMFADIRVVGEAGEGAAAVEFASQLSPDIVLMDLVMPGLNGIEATRQICERCPGTKVIALTSFMANEQIVDALAAGASGYLLKDVIPADLAKAIRTVYQGEAELHPLVAKKLIEGLQKENKEPEIQELTRREMQVLRLVGNGLSNQEIAEELVISRRTVKAHVSSILNKLNLTDRTQIAIYAIKHGLNE